MNGLLGVGWGDRGIQFILQKKTPSGRLCEGWCQRKRFETERCSRCAHGVPCFLDVLYDQVLKPSIKNEAKPSRKHALQGKENMLRLEALDQTNWVKTGPGACFIIQPEQKKFFFQFESGARDVIVLDPAFQAEERVSAKAPRQA